MSYAGIFRYRPVLHTTGKLPLYNLSMGRLPLTLSQPYRYLNCSYGILMPAIPMRHGYTRFPIIVAPAIPPPNCSCRIPERHDHTCSPLPSCLPRPHRSVAASINLPVSINPPAWQGFLASFYGAFDEEILMRLFVLTLLAWIGSRFSRTKEGRPTLAVLWIANLLAAILFGLGHLPATQAAGFPLNGLVIGLALVLNGLVGIATGWLYWSRGLGSAMLAHFSGDILLHVILPVLI